MSGWAAWRFAARACGRASILAAIVLAAHGTAFGQAPPIQADLRNEQPIPAVVGTGITLALRVTNPGASAREVVTRIETPANWQVLFARERFAIAPQGFEIELITVVPPRDAPAGDYTLRYVVASATGELPVTVSIAVSIRERREISLNWLASPGYLPVGEIGTLDLLVTNRGNAPATVTLDVRSRLGSKLVTTWSGGVLAAGEDRHVRVDVRPVAPQLGNVNESVTATAVADRLAIRSRAETRFDIIPRNTLTSSQTRQLPMALAFRSGTNHRIGFGSFVGGGELSPGGPQVDFEARSRDRSHPFMIEQDRYALNLTGRRGRVAAGDQPWSLSRLTEAGHYGFGAGGEVDAKHVFATGFMDTGRRDIRESTQTGGSVGLRFKRAILSAQYLTRFRNSVQSPREAQLVSLRLQFAAPKGLKGDFEAGQGRSPAGSGRAFSGEISETLRRASFGVRRAGADDVYPIRNRNAVVDAARVSLRPFGRLQLQGLANATERIQDPRLPPNAPSSWRQTQASIGWGNLFSLNGTRTAWISPGMSWSNAWQRESIRGQVKLPLGRVTLTPAAERGFESTPGFPAETPFLRNLLEVAVRFGAGSSAYVQGEMRKGVPGDSQRVLRTASFGGQIRPLATTLLSLQVSNSSDEAPWLQGSRWIDATLDHRLPWQHHIVATYRRLSSATALLPSDEAFRVDYVIPLGIPTKQTATGSGRLSVRLLDESGQPLPRLIVRTGDEPRLTDRTGVAEFADLAPQVYFVTIDPMSLGSDRITVPALPIKTTVTPGHRAQIEAKVVRSAKVTGVFQLVQVGTPQVEGQAPPRVPAGVVAGAVLELVSGSDRRGAVTDREGHFEFADLPPGEWRLSIVRADVPAFYMVEDPPSAFVLRPGDNRALTLQAVPKQVQIDFGPGQ